MIKSFRKRKFINHKKRILYVSLFFLLLLISIGYAYISTSLSINGVSTIAANSWNIHFENLSVSNGSSVASTPATIQNDTTKINYSVLLDLPGDFYEFEVDVVNSGTIPGKVSLVNISGISSEAEPYLESSVKYVNGNSVQIGDILNPGTGKRIVVRVGYIEDLNTLPEDTIELDLEFEIDYSQTEEEEITTDTIIQQLKTENSSCFTKYEGQVTDQVGQTVTAQNVYFNKCADKRNIIFNNMCWQVIRTTETGGIKMVYNGEPDNNNQCGSSRGEHKGIVSSTYGTFTRFFSGVNMNEEYSYSTLFTYNTTTNEFTLVNPIRAIWSASTYENLLGKFTCLDDTDTCTTLFYISFYSDDSEAYVASYNVDDTNYAGIGTSTFNAYYGSLTYSGYMYNKADYIDNQELASGSLVGNDVSYSNGVYTLLPASGESVLGTTMDNTHHYTCNNTTGTCNKVRFYPLSDAYIELDGGAKIEDILNGALYGDDVNNYNSSIKGVIDSWFAQNMADKTNMLEDTVFCNARNVLNQDTTGWNKDGIIGLPINFKNESEFVTDMTCTNITDQFAVSNNKAKLTYPVGLIQNEEISNINTPSLMATGEPWFTISPINSFGTSNNVVFVDTDGSSQGNFVGIAYGTRPVVSLKSGVLFIGGTGSETDPWVIE